MKQIETSKHIMSIFTRQQCKNARNKSDEHFKGEFDITSKRSREFPFIKPIECEEYIIERKKGGIPPCWEKELTK
jgi:hypothetical protein